MLKLMGSGVRRIAGAACLAALAGLPTFAQTNPSWPAPEAYANNNFDSRDKVKVGGEIARVETINGATIVWVAAKTAVQQGFGARPGTDIRGGGMLWRVEGPGLGKVKDPASLVAGAKVNIWGENWDDKSCKPTCRMRAERVMVK